MWTRSERDGLGGTRETEAEFFADPSLGTRISWPFPQSPHDGQEGFRNSGCGGDGERASGCAGDRSFIFLKSWGRFQGGDNVNQVLEKRGTLFGIDLKPELLNVPGSVEDTQG